MALDKGTTSLAHWMNERAAPLSIDASILSRWKSGKTKRVLHNNLNVVSRALSISPQFFKNSDCLTFSQKVQETCGLDLVHAFEIIEKEQQACTLNDPGPLILEQTTQRVSPDAVHELHKQIRGDYYVFFHWVDQRPDKDEVQTIKVAHLKIGKLLPKRLVMHSQMLSETREWLKEYTNEAFNYMGPLIVLENSLVLLLQNTARNQDMVWLHTQLPTDQFRFLDGIVSSCATLSATRRQHPCSSRVLLVRDKRLYLGKGRSKNRNGSFRQYIGKYLSLSEIQTIDESVGARLEQCFHNQLFLEAASDCDAC